MNKPSLFIHEFKSYGFLVTGTIILSNVSTSEQAFGLITPCTHRLIRMWSKYSAIRKQRYFFDLMIGTEFVGFVKATSTGSTDPWETLVISLTLPLTPTDGINSTDPLDELLGAVDSV